MRLQVKPRKEYLMSSDIIIVDTLMWRTNLISSADFNTI